MFAVTEYGGRPACQLSLMGDGDGGGDGGDATVVEVSSETWFDEARRPWIEVGGHYHTGVRETMVEVFWRFSCASGGAVTAFVDDFAFTPI